MSEYTSKSAGGGCLILGILAALVLLGVLALTTATTGNLADAERERTAAQQIAERERTERARLAEETTRQATQLRAEQDARVTHILAELGFLVTAALLIIVVFGAMLFGATWLDAKATRNTLLLIEMQRQAAMLQLTPPATMVVGRLPQRAVEYHER
ncbi:MAG: hypothetical protein FJ011_26410 [Chloroflexi bacterium]|nr:hypothetical protein [Chloroflexota bacterium]